MNRKPRLTAYLDTLIILRMTTFVLPLAAAILTPTCLIVFASLAAFVGLPTFLYCKLCPAPADQGEE